MRNDFALDNFLLEKQVLRHMEPEPVAEPLPEMVPPLSLQQMRQFRDLAAAPVTAIAGVINGDVVTALMGKRYITHLDMVSLPELPAELLREIIVEQGWKYNHYQDCWISPNEDKNG